MGRTDVKLCGCRRESTVRWVYSDGVYGTMCQFHLDMWLDLADDGEIEEPAALAWLC
jgi:hypothetical protein